MILVSPVIWKRSNGVLTILDLAQIQVATLRLDSIIVELLKTEGIPEQALDYAIDLLSWTTEKLTAMQMRDDTSVNTFTQILDVSLQYDEDHYYEYAAILVHYLQDSEFQQTIATPEILDKLVDLMLDFEARLNPEEIESVFKSLSVQSDPDKLANEDTS